MIEIELLTAKNEEAYRRFLSSNPRTLIYATVEYRNFLEAVTEGQPYYLLAFRQGQLVGVLPYFRKEQPGWGTIINSLPWYGSHGGCTLAANADNDVRQALLTKYAQAISTPEVLVATLIVTPFEDECLPVYADKLNPPFTDKRMGQITHLPNYGDELEQQLLMSFKQKTRNLVRKSLQQGFVRLVTDEDWAWRFLYETHLENIQAIGGRPKPWEHFMALREAIPAQWRQLSVATLANQPVAALLLLYFNKTVEYFTPVIKHPFRSRQPLSFLIWHAMLQASQTGYHGWNWGGTWLSQQSLYHFKAGWGAINCPYTYLINITGKSVASLKANLSHLQQAFPYFYIFPYSML